MSDTTFFRGENPLRADKLNLAFSEKVQRTGDTMMGVLTLYGDPTNAMDAATKQYVDTNFSTSLAGTFLRISGGTMQGFIALHAPPVQPLHAASKGYVDALVAASTGAGTYLPLAGGTLTGPLTLSSDPSNPLHSATKQYVDTKIAAIPPSSGGGGASVSVSDTPPATPAQGDMWFDSTNAQLFLRYEDANSKQWVVANTGGSAVAVIADTPPSLSSGGLWWDSKGGQLYVRYDDGNSAAYVAATNVQGAVNAATKTEVAAAQNNSGRNLIHNGLFNVAQRGAGPWTTSQYTADRWLLSLVLDAPIVSRLAMGDTVRTEIGDEAGGYILSNTFTGNAGATANNYIIQRIEDVRRLAGKVVIVSFWAKCGAGALKLGVDMPQVFGTGGSPSATVTGTGQAVTLSIIWTRYSLTFTLPSIVGKTLGTNGDDFTQIGIWYSAGANSATRAGNIGVQSGTINIWGVQLEIAATGQTQPSPLDKPDPQVDLANCQRFFRKVITGVRNHNALASKGMSAAVSWPEMRASPTATLAVAGFQANTVGPYTINVNYPGGGYFDCTSGAAAGDAYALQYLFSLSADL